MLPPVRCFTCNKVLPFECIQDGCVAGRSLGDAMNVQGLKRICCRRMIIAHPPHVEEAMLMQRVRDDCNEAMQYQFSTAMRGRREEVTD